MKILLKCPTRSRPQKVIKTLELYIRKAKRPDLLGVALSCDTDDTTMTNLVWDDIQHICRKTAYSQIFRSNNKTKIEAVNADMEKIEYAWDILLLVSDDMIPIVDGYDEVLRNHMKAYFPDTDGILWVKDGYQNENLNTLSILGRKMYERFGYIYHPLYKSLFCDTEFTDLCRNELKDKCFYISTTLIRHEHPVLGYGTYDELFTKNQLHWYHDFRAYIDRKKYQYEWSILIPTMPEREESLSKLIDRIRNHIGDRKVEICLNYDLKTQSIGMKRNQLLQTAKGKYCSFVDDDDDLTPEYFEDCFACIDAGKDVCRLRGKIGDKYFEHRLAMGLDDKMAEGDTFYRRPNHLNLMLIEVAKSCPFPETSWQEDNHWWALLAKADFLRTEYIPSDPTRVHYIYNSRASDLNSAIGVQSTISLRTFLGDPTMNTNDKGQQEKSSNPKDKRLVFTPRGFVSS